MIPELSRPIALDRARDDEQLVEADATERGAVAARLGLVAIGVLSCRFRLSDEDRGVHAASGHLRARFTQTCVVSLDEFETLLDERFRVRFVPDGMLEDLSNNRLDPEADDEVPYAGSVINLGEATVEQLALLLDPYPRKPGAAVPAVAQAAEAHPFAALSKLRRPN